MKVGELEKQAKTKHDEHAEECAKQALAKSLRRVQLAELEVKSARRAHTKLLERDVSEFSAEQTSSTRTSLFSKNFGL